MLPITIPIICKGENIKKVMDSDNEGRDVYGRKYGLSVIYTVESFLSDIGIGLREETAFHKNHIAILTFAR